MPPSFVDNIQASKDYEIIPRKNIELQNVTEIRNKNNGAIVTLKGTHSDENDYLYTSLSSNGYFAATLCHGKSSKKVDFPHTLKLWNAVIGKELLSQKLSQKMLLAPLKSPIKINNSIPNKTEFAIESSDFYTYRSSLEFSDPSYIVYTINHFPLLPKNFFTEQKEK